MMKYSELKNKGRNENEKRKQTRRQLTRFFTRQ